jgi:hypothetical protein
MTIASSKLLLSILPNEYETLSVRGLVRSGEGDVDDHRQAGRMTSGGALSKANAYWKAARGTAHVTRMHMIQSPPRGLTSVKGRSFGLSYAEMVTSSTG